MNFVTEYYNFKHKWYFKISSLLLDFYLCKDVNNQVNKIKYEYLNDLIESYINNEKINDIDVIDKLNNINYKDLNKLEFELLKHVLLVSNNYEDIKFNDTDYIYFAIILELSIQIYNTSFNIFNEKIIYNILKENLFRFEFIDFKRKQSKVNILLKYLKFINKNIEFYFSNLKNKNISINTTALSNHRGYYIVEIENKLSKLLKFDSELVETVEKNNGYRNKLFTLNLDILVQQIVYLIEKDKFSVNKVIFNLDDYTYSRKVVNFINNMDNIVTKHIVLCSKDKKKLDVISNKYEKCIFIKDDKEHKFSNYKDITILIQSSYWQKHKKDSKKLEGLKFITINDNIGYKFYKEVK